MLADIAAALARVLGFNFTIAFSKESIPFFASVMEEETSSQAGRRRGRCSGGMGVSVSFFVLSGLGRRLFQIAGIVEDEVGGCWGLLLPVLDSLGVLDSLVC